MTKAQQARLDRVKTTARAHLSARKQFDAAIVSARKAGLTQRAIADAAGVTHRTVQVTLAKVEAA